MQVQSNRREICKRIRPGRRSLSSPLLLPTQAEDPQLPDPDRQFHKHIHLIRTVRDESRPPVETDRIFPMGLGGDHQPSHSPIPGGGDKRPQNLSSDSPSPTGFPDGHANDPSFVMVLPEKTSGPDDHPLITFSHKEQGLRCRIGFPDIIRIGIARLVDKAELFAESFQDATARLRLIASAERSNSYRSMGRRHTGRYERRPVDSGTIA